jgi:hypothetical protein
MLGQYDRTLSGELVRSDPLSLRGITRLFASRCLEDADSDQHDDADTDPDHRHVEIKRGQGEANNKDDEADEVGRE